MEQIFEYLKENQKNIALGLFLILIISLSFGLGYLVNREFTHAPIVIEKCSDLIADSKNIQ
ncbi:MAG: hypothetical protein AAB405_01550 [Patescibacteria group bacterium]